jgi:AmiR/NasT family two-component response regulator
VLDEAQTTEALAFSDAATVLLLHLQQQAPSDQLSGQIDAALASRAEVHQATGMVSVQAGLDLADALAVLRAHAFTSGRPLNDVAGDVVARRLRFHLGGVDNE